MPTFFNKDTLTPEQSARYESASREYEAIQNNNAIVQFQALTKAQLQKLKLQLKVKEDQEVQDHFLTMIRLHNPDSKSALFFRLLNDKKPLLYPPPCSYSYPWYNIIESNDAQEIHPDCNTINDFPSYGKNRITIEQTSWEIIKKISETEAILTYGMWKQLGFTWQLKQESILCRDSTMKIISHYNPDLKSITTLQELENEVEYQVMNDFKNLNLVLHPQTQEAYKLECETKYGKGFGSGMFDTALSSGQYTLNARREKSLPQYPTNEEIQSLVADKVKDYFDRGFTADDKGNLYLVSWTLKRITPEVLPNIYLEI